MRHNITTILKRIWTLLTYPKVYKVYTKVFQVTRVDEDTRIINSAEYKEGILSDKVTCHSDCRATGATIGSYIQWHEVLE